MYRIELAPGEETVYRNIDELATAVRRGLVGARSRIYHNASQKWLPIEFHPHYKRILENPNAKTLELPPSLAEPPMPSVFKSTAATKPPEPEANPQPEEPEAPAPTDVADAPAAAPPVMAIPSPVRELPPFEPPPAASLALSPVVAPWRRADDPLSIPEWPGAAAPVVDEEPEHSLEPPEPEPDIVIHPAAETSDAGRRSPLRMVAAAAGVATVGYALFAAFGPSRGAGVSDPAAPSVAERPTMPPTAPAHAPKRAPARAASVPSSVTAGFGAAAPDRPVESTAPVGSPPALPGSESTVIAPAPPASALEVALPALPTDSLVAAPKSRGDSAAMKQILRAVSGKPNSASR